MVGLTSLTVEMKENYGMSICADCEHLKIEDSGFSPRWDYMCTANGIEEPEHIDPLTGKVVKARWFYCFDFNKDGECKEFTRVEDETCDSDTYQILAEMS